MITYFKFSEECGFSQEFLPEYRLLAKKLYKQGESYIVLAMVDAEAE
jgi:hypothetical protein